LTVPRAFGVHDLDDESTAIWLEPAPGRPVPWDLDRHRRAACLLGRPATSPSVAPLATRVPPGCTARRYADWWSADNVVPDLRGDELWRRPMVAGAFDADLIMIDFGFRGTGPVGFDLGRLLLAEVHRGERPARALPELEGACVPAYVDGLRDEGSTVTFEQVRRCHALLLTIHHAIPAMPFEHREPPRPRRCTGSTPNEPPRPASSSICWTPPAESNAGR
jgi:hypothetical protein